MSDSAKRMVTGAEAFDASKEGYPLFVRTRGGHLLRVPPEDLEKVYATLEYGRWIYLAFVEPVS